MKKSLMVATFLAAGGGAVGVSAGNPASFKGSDTLFDFTNAMIAACPGTQLGSPVLAYAGTGSGNGEKAMLAGTQQIAPMSRFMNKNACTGTSSSPTTSQGLVVGLDGVSIVGSKSTYTSTACNGDSNANCAPGFEANTGAAFDTTPIAGYTFADWRDVLRVLLAGFDHGNTGTNAAAIAARDCNSATRVALANTYGSLFENNCTAPAGDQTGGVCTQIRHIYRRDDFSGTTDTMVGLLNLPSTVTPETSVTVFPNGVSTTITQHTGYDPFCNSVRPAFMMPQSAAGTCASTTCTTTCADGSTCSAGNCTTNKCTVGGTACGDGSTCTPSQPEPSCMTGADATWTPTSKFLGTGVCSPACTAGQVCDNGHCVAASGTCSPACVAGQVCVGGVCTAVTTACASQSLSCCANENAVYRSTMQDNDPIRRTCFGAANGALGTFAEDNCEHSGDLGLVLVMNDVPETGDVGTTSDPLRYNASPCVRSHFSSATAPDVYDNFNQGKQICTRGLLCPNGDFCTNTGGCIVPVDSTGNTQCLGNKLTAPATPANAIPVPVAHPVNAGVAEGRAYNQHLYKQVGSAAAYQNNGFTTPLPMTGAFYRIHTSHSMNPASTTAAPITCGNPAGPSSFPDMTDQIGCLVNASPCSIGYAGRGAADHNPTTTDAIKIHGQNPLGICITGDGANIAGFTYPLSRKLYLDTVPGFAAVTANEQALVGCETNLAQANPPLPAASNAGLVTTNIVNVGFLAIPSFYNSGNPYCEDFNENMLCSPSPTAPLFPTNSASCPTSVPANFTAFPTTNSTTCGNGIQEQYEDCDCGTAQVAASAPAANVTACGTTINGGTVCTTTCRTVH